MSNHYVEFEVRCGDEWAKYRRLTDAYVMYDRWIALGYRDIILVRVDINEEVLESCHK